MFEWFLKICSFRARIKDLAPTSEPSSRLPRANPKKIKLTTSQNNHSSSDSSRNSSPGMNQNRVLNPGGSPSLRRSLLLAAKAPQVPPSPTINRKSTLTQPTAASAAKSTPSKNTKVQPPKNTIPSKISVPYREKIALVKRAEIKTADMKKDNKKKVDNRPHSPFKYDSRSSSPRKSDSRLGSPIKTTWRSSSPLKSDSQARSLKQHANDHLPCNTSKSFDIKKQPTKPTVIRKNPSDSQILPRTNLITQQRMMKHAINLEKSKSSTMKINRTQVKSNNLTSNSVTSKKTKPTNKSLRVKQKSPSPVLSISPDNDNVRYSPEGIISPDTNQIQSCSSKVTSESTDMEGSVEKIQRSDSSQSNSENEFFIRKCPVMHRSDTFLKEEPTVIGKLK